MKPSNITIIRNVKRGTFLLGDLEHDSESHNCFVAFLI